MRVHITALAYDEQVRDRQPVTITLTFADLEVETLTQALVLGLSRGAAEAATRLGVSGSTVSILQERGRA